MKNLFLLLGILSTQFLPAQDPLSFSFLGSESAYCRTAEYQSGNGVVFCAVVGGTPTYTFEWTNLITGATNPSTTWGGLNYGDYRIEVTDAEGASIIDTVHVDSINPIASMSLIGELAGGPEVYTGDAPLEITFENTSENVQDALFPDPDPVYYFKPISSDPYTTSQSIWTDFNHTYNYDGTWIATLIAINKNGCTDTTNVTIIVNGTVSLEEEIKPEVIQVYSISNNVIQISLINPIEIPLQFNLYSLSGMLIRSVGITEQITRVENDLSEGMYLYEIINPKTRDVLQSGKVVR